MTEAERVATLKGYGVLDTPNEPVFDAIVRSVAVRFGVPCALVSFIDEHRQWYKARHGIDVAWLPRAISFCTHSIERGGITVIPDARADERFNRNPCVTGPDGIRFYAAAPIKAANHARIGTVCIFDRVPRPALDERERRILATFADRVTAALEGRRAAA